MVYFSRAALIVLHVFAIMLPKMLAIFMLIDADDIEPATPRHYFAPAHADDLRRDDVDISPR